MITFRPGRVFVYLYMYWDEEAGGRKSSSVYATEQAIRNGLGIPIYTTAKEVDSSDLSEGGIYVPKSSTTA
jgi:hypothetical protein